MTLNTNTKYAVVARIRNFTKMCANPSCRCLETAETKVCRKCGGQLTTPYSDKDGKRTYYAFHEITWDIGGNTGQLELQKAVKEQKGILPIYTSRFWYRMDKESNKLVPDKRIPYLSKGREVNLTYHKEIIPRPPYMDGSGQMCIEMPIAFENSDKRAIEFLPEKNRTNVVAKSVDMPRDNIEVMNVENILAPLNELIKSLQNKRNILANNTSLHIPQILPDDIDNINSELSEIAGLQEEDMPDCMISADDC